MPQGKCNNHGQIEAEWKEVTRKSDGKQFKFWGCPTKEKDNQGNWIKCRVEVANTPSGKFEQSLDKSSAQMDIQHKDELIRRTAIAKSLIESGRWQWNLDNSQAAENWVAWCQGKKPHVKPSEPEVEPPVAPQEEEISLEDIPF